ncbi:MAG: type I-E CRISPR-associated endonuclease Cas1e [Gemmatimonadales bacterium]|nr:type I-E CRISPR-associated endonuclease Cas1e [Gemmatimonadales bacterium]
MLQVRHRLSFFYVERGTLAVIDACLVLADGVNGARFEVPARATTVIMIGPGTSVTTEAVRLAAAYGVQLIWTGEHGVRCYSAGRAWTELSRWLERQVTLWSDPVSRLGVARKMFGMRFHDSVERRSLEQLRGIEGARVREFYKQAATAFGIRWTGRRYPGGGPSSDFDAPNRALNVANTCLYGIAEVAVQALGASPGLGFIHSGSAVAFVLDVADLYKTELAIPACFGLVSRKAPDGEPWATLESDVRRLMRDEFREGKLVERIVADVEKLLDAGDSG